MTKKLSLVGLILLAVAACAPSGTQSAGAAPTPRPVPDGPPIAASTLRTAPRDWQLLDEAADQLAGISANRATRELLASMQPKRTVVVAVIDGGVDTTHADLRANIWVNPKEIAGNGKDDDGNGYVDDVHGWNFIGGRDGRDIDKDTYEVTRLYARCQAGAGGSGPPLPSAAECKKITAEVEGTRDDAEQTLQRIQTYSDALTRSLLILKQTLGTDSVTLDKVQSLAAVSPDVQQAKSVYLQLSANGITIEVVDGAKKEYESQLQFAYNPAYDPRPIVGDNPANLTERGYGNADVGGPDPLHGTHVAGIIGATRGNNIGIDGVATQVRIMSVRAVPDGDERDKDVANAIRYAVDNGANVVNMSFGKAYSPYKSTVDDAVKYADAHGVLLIHSAGNDGQDSDVEPSFPNRLYASGGTARNWIEVGASSWKGGDSLPAFFSNYGRTAVDVFAPGLDILSSVPGDGYQRESGTSMAAPVVTGLAALIMEYYPTLTASDVKDIILASSTRHAGQQVVEPGTDAGPKVPFGSLSVTGGVVNAYAALKMAEIRSGAKK